MTKTLSHILAETRCQVVQGSTDRAITGITFDSREAGPGKVFVAIRGTAADGHKFIGDAVSKGVAAVVAEELSEAPSKEVTWVKAENTRRELAHMAASFYDHPSRKLSLVGVTGTNGKTTIATLLYRLFRHEGYCAGLLSTIGIQIDDEEISTRLTTPDVVTVNRLLNRMLEKGCTHCFMEVSSHAVVQYRTAGLHFAGGIFTNISHDHLDYHATFKDYLNAKKGFFDQLPDSAFALTNADDKNGNVMLQNTRAKQYRYGIKQVAEYRAQILESHKEGMILLMDNHEVATRFIGHFNAYNLLAVYAAARLLNIDQQQAFEAISELEPVRGRFETVISPDKITAVIDYAHSPDALKNLFQALDYFRTGNETLISLLGAGGDRDKQKRPKMAGIVARFADKVILTSDNPRTENPQAIIEDMKAGVAFEEETKIVAIPDRKEAIRSALMMAKPGDIVVVPGKGHETYQEINGVRYHFDDREILMEEMKTLKTNE